MLDAGAEQVGEGVTTALAALRGIEHQRECAVGGFDTWLCTIPPGSSTSWTGVFWTLRSEV